MSWVLQNVFAATAVLAFGATSILGAPPPVAKSAEEVLTPSKLSFRCDDLTPPQIVDALSKQLGMDLQPRIPNSRSKSKKTYSIDEKDKPYLLLVHEVCEKTGLCARAQSATAAAPFAMEQRLKEDDACRLLPKDSESAVLPVLAKLFFAKFKKPEGLVTDKTHLHLVMDWLTEPKVYVIGCKQTEFDQMTAGTGEAIGAVQLQSQNQFDPSGYRYSRSNGMVTQMFTIDLPAENLKTIKKFSGSITMMVGLEVIEQDLSGLLNGQAVDMPVAGNAAFHFEQYVRDDYGSCSIKLSFPANSRVNGVALDQSPQLHGMHFLVTDADGNVFDSGPPTIFPLRGDRRNAQGVVWNLVDKNGRPNDKATPAKILCYVPTKVAEVKIPFEFDDMPIPAAK